MTRAKPYLGVPPEHFHQEGESQVYTRHNGRSGKAVENHFCGTCGAYVLGASSSTDLPRGGRRACVDAEMAGSCTRSTRSVSIVTSTQVCPHPPGREDSRY